MRVLLEIALLGVAFSGYVRWPGRQPDLLPRAARGSRRMLRSE